MQCCDCSCELDDALILVCDHNLCLDCAAKKGNVTGVIKCRVCLSLTSLEPGSVQQLREMFPQYSSTPSQSAATPMRSLSLLQRPPLPNLPAQTSSPALSSRSMPLQLPMPSSTVQQSTACGQCERSNADLRCLQCEELLCFDCSESLHRRGRLAAHQTVPLAYNPTGSSTPMSSSSPMSRSQDRSVITMRSVSCSAHVDEIVQYFCLKCETRPMCSECVFRSGEHTGHLQDVVLVKKAFPKVRSRINDLVVEFEKSIKDIKINEINLVENKKSIENISANCKGQISKLFNDVRETLRLREHELMGKVESVVDSEIRHLEKDIQKNHDKRVKIESVSQLLNSVRDVQGSGASFEREIELLEAFSEMKSSVTESRAELMRNELSIVQLFISPDQMVRMQRLVETMKHSIADLPGITPSRNAPVEQVEPVISTSKSKVSRSKRSSPAATSSDLFLMNAIEDALRAS